MNYYNENDPKAAAWLRELIRAGEISMGEVDERSIVEVKTHELKGYAQCHWFAGIGGWSLALRLARWPDDKPVWTASLPCQPFSTAGDQRAEADERHLWPVFAELVRHGQPSIAFGEQVASKLGREWLAGVRDDLEGMGYEVGASDLCAASVGAPHRRQRLYWVAHSIRDRLSSRGGVQGGAKGTGITHGHDVERCGSNGSLADVQRAGLQERGEYQGIDKLQAVERNGSAGSVAHSALSSKERLTIQRKQLSGSAAWNAFDVIHCLDGKARRVESGTFPLAHGVPGRVGLLRGYGNSIVPQIAEVFIRSCIEAIGI